MLSTPTKRSVQSRTYLQTTQATNDSQSQVTQNVTGGQ
jgi:hypothetical protein